jgi:hypothetical protein
LKKSSGKQDPILEHHNYTPNGFTKFVFNQEEEAEQEDVQGNHIDYHPTTK